MPPHTQHLQTQRPPQPPQNAVEQEMRDAMEDHATKLDTHQQYIRTLTQNQVDGFTSIERKDAELRDKLQQLEAQVVKNDTRLDTAETQIAMNDTRLATAETVVSANDDELKKNLLILEQQLAATEGVAAAAMAATTADGSSAATAASHAALVTRLEQHEAYIAKVEQMARGFANDHQNKGQQMYDIMNTEQGAARARLAALETWQQGVALQSPTAAQSGTQGAYAFPATRLPSF